MVNYKRVVCEVAVLAFIAVLASAAPHEDKHYDQRQNGTENYRLNIDGVVIAVAPADALLAAASDLDFTDLLEIGDLEDLQKPPKPPADSAPSKPGEIELAEEKPQDSKPEAPEKQPALKPDAPEKPSESLSDVSLNSDIKGQKKDASFRKHEKAQRLKNRLASMLLPLLRRNRHH